MEIPELKFEGFAVLLERALPDKLCDKIIEKLGSKKWEDALINGGTDGQILDKNIRFCKRIMEIDYKLGDYIMSIVDKFLPDNITELKKININPMFRYLKYGPGNYFKPHYDGPYEDNNGNVSLITIQMYLNDDFKGGETVFYDACDGKKIYTHVPKKGDIILFEQTIEHTALTVTEGIKYSVRTEVMYGPIDTGDQ